MSKQGGNNPSKRNYRAPQHNRENTQPKSQQKSKCLYCKREGHWIDHCFALQKDIPILSVRNQVKQLLKGTASTPLEHSARLISHISGQHPESNVSGSDLASNSDKTSNELESVSGGSPDIAGTIAGTLEDLSDEILYISPSAPSNESLYLPIMVNGVKTNSLVDSGSTLTVLHPNTYYQIPVQRRPSLTGEPIRLRMADGSLIESLGKAPMEIKIKGHSFQHHVTVAEVESSSVLGYDFLKSQNCQVNFGTGVLSFNDTHIPCVKLNQLEETLQITLKEAVTLPPYSESIVPAIVSQATLPSELATLYVNPTEEILRKEGLVIAKIVLDPNSRDVPLRVANLGDQSLTLSKNTLIGTGEPVDVLATLTEIKSADPCVNHITEQESSPVTCSIPSHLQAMWDECCEILDEDQKLKAVILLNTVKDTFSKDKSDLGQTVLVSHRINTGNAHPIKQSARRLPLAKRAEAEAEAEVQRMLQKGIIEPSCSPWSSPIVLIRKKDGSVRFCIDYRKLNSVTVKDSYPLPRIDESLDALGKAEWFTTLDLTSGYWQVPVHPSDMEKTAFVTPSGLFQFRVLPFGLTNAPATFQRLMECVVAGLHWHTCLLYHDDIIIYSPDFDSHLCHLKEVLDRIAQAGLKLNPKKCHLFQKQVEYLGHVVSSKGISTNPEKIKAVKDWPQPQSLSELRSYLGLCSYYRRFIRNFSTIAHPLCQLMEKNTPFLWSHDCDIPFESLKHALISSPLLSYPTPGDPFILDTDASSFGVGAVLSQVRDGKEHVIGYFSQTLSKPERNYCVTRRELLAIILALKHFHPYLYGVHFLIRTDHGALTWLLNFKHPEGQIARWLQFLSNYDYKIEHRSGNAHRNADALSRRPCRDDPCRYCDNQESYDEARAKNEVSKIPHIKAITEQHDISNWVEGISQRQLREAQLQDPNIGPVLKWMENKQRPTWDEISHLSSTVKSYVGCWPQLQLWEGVLYRRIFSPISGDLSQLILPESLRSTILSSLHQDVTSGHLGVNRTLDKVKARFFWVKMQKDIARWCRECKECQLRKKPTKQARSPMQKCVAGAPMERIALDILGPLPETHRRNRYILVVGDYFSKWIDAWAMPDMETDTIVDILVPHVFCQWGLPLHIHSDRGSQFESELFQKLCAALGITKTRTTAYHPQSNGMIERFNQTLETMLSKYVSENHRDWDRFLPLVMLSYRGSTHDSTGFSPALMFLGWEPRLPIDLMIGSPPGDTYCSSTSYTDYIELMQHKMHQVHDLARRKLLLASERQKRTYDHRKHHLDYNPGDPVYVRDVTRKKGCSPKLQPRWKDPYMVLGLICDFVYEIQRSPKSRKETVHHDRLKPYYGEFQSWLRPNSNESRSSSCASDQNETRPHTENPPKIHPLKPDLPPKGKPEQQRERPPGIITRSGRQSRRPAWFTNC